MIKITGFNNINLKTSSSTHLSQSSNAENNQSKSFNYATNSINFKANFLSQNSINTQLSESDRKKYTYLMDYLKNAPISKHSNKTSCQKQLEILLKNGKLLQKSIHDGSTTLDNLYNIATKKRTNNLNPVNLISNILDDISNYQIVTQKFGDIPNVEKQQILSQTKDPEIKQNPSLIDVEASGVCPSASINVTYLHNYPADFARLVSEISGEERKSSFNVDLKSINKNALQALEILKILEVPVEKFSLDKISVKVAPDDNAFIRAKIQEQYYDLGERNSADVLVQSAFMQLGAQGSYNSLTDIRVGKFNDNPKGLIEQEKTLVETLAKNKEITSLVYQKVDENENLVGYNCSFDKMQKHIIDTLDNGEDVIIGYVLTNEMVGVTKQKDYNPKVHGAPNRVINGHEITIVGYKKDSNNNIIFICVDTDDDSDVFVEYKADWLLPKIHHAGYPANIVKDDEQEILDNFNKGVA